MDTSVGDDGKRRPTTKHHTKEWLSLQRRLIFPCFLFCTLAPRSVHVHTRRERKSWFCLNVLQGTYLEPLHFVLLTFSSSASFYVLHISTGSSCSPSSVLRADRRNDGIFFILHRPLFIKTAVCCSPLSLRCSYGAYIPKRSAQSERCLSSPIIHISESCAPCLMRPLRLTGVCLARRASVFI